MKSLAAWSFDREFDKKRKTEHHASPPENSIEQATELDAVLEALIKSTSLYEVIIAHRRQRKVMRSWVSEQSVLVKSTVTEQTERIRENLARAVAGTIVPLLAEVIEKKSVTDFCEAVEEVIQKTIEKNAVILVPQRLHESVIAEMKRRGLDVKLEASAVDEIILQAGDTRIETTITQFTSQIEGAVAK